MTKTRLFGFILMGLGVILVATGSILYPFAVVVYAPLLTYWPNGSLSSPCAVTVGSSVRPQIIFGGQIPNNNVSFRVSGVGFSYSTSLPVYSWAPLSTAYMYVGLNWTVPNEPTGSKFEMTFVAVNSTVATSYLEIMLVSAYFTINGQMATQASYIISTTATLVINLVATAGGNQITGAGVDVTNPSGFTQTYSLTQVQTGTLWTLNYTMPATGTYEIDGWYSTSAITTHAMLVMAMWGTTTPSAPTPVLSIILLFTGVPCIVAGAGVLMYSRKPKR